MSSHQHYHICRRYHGRVVRIEDYDGNVHIGRIVDITDESVWIEPVHRQRFDHGFGYYDTGYDGGGCDYCGGLRDCNYCGYGYARGFGGYGGYGGFGGVELAFGFIFGITLAALFFI